MDWGSVETIAVLVLTAGIAWRISRGGGGSAVSELSKANEVLERRVDEQGKEIRDLKMKNAELASRTDFGATMAIHEERAAQRHQATLRVLDLIAARLGPDNGTPI